MRYKASSSRAEKLRAWGCKRVKTGNIGKTYATSYLSSADALIILGLQIKKSGMAREIWSFSRALLEASIVS